MQYDITKEEAYKEFYRAKAYELELEVGNITLDNLNLQEKLQDAQDTITMLESMVTALKTRLQQEKERADRILACNISIGKTLETRTEVLNQKSDRVIERNLSLCRELDDYIRIAETYANENAILKEEKTVLAAQVQTLNTKLESKDNTINFIKNRAEGTPVIVEGTERDLYNGEARSMILDIIKEKIKEENPWTRRYHIFKSILEANQDNGDRDNIFKAVQNVFTSNGDICRMSVSDRKKLEEVGFDVVKTGSHYSLVLNRDDRYAVTVSSTASCPRSGKNTIESIRQVLF